MFIEQQPGRAALGKRKICILKHFLISDIAWPTGNNFET